MLWPQAARCSSRKVTMMKGRAGEAAGAGGLTSGFPRTLQTTHSFRLGGTVATFSRHGFEATAGQVADVADGCEVKVARRGWVGSAGQIRLFWAA